MVGILTRHGAAVESVFDLLGHDENDLTAALGYALSRCPKLLSALLERFSARLEVRVEDDADLALEVADALGRTDLEIRLSAGLLICEAKQGWLLPDEDQLRLYAGRVRSYGGNGALITLSRASQALAAATLPSHVDGISVVHISWSEILTDARDVRSNCRGQERLWLEEFLAFVEGVVRVRSVADSWTYCVVLNEDRTGGKRDLSFLEWVTEELTYFHPVSGWPKDPPNFLAFRWHGAVQRIHRVESYEVVPTLLDRFPDLPVNERTLQAHVVYKLSPYPLPLAAPIPNGARYRANRLWVLLDQLQTAETLAEAVRRSRELEATGHWNAWAH